MMDERSDRQALSSEKTISELQTGIEPATFWWPVRCSSHWATKTQMVSQGASSTYVRPKCKPLYVNHDIDEIYILEFWELLLTYSGFCLGRTYAELAPLLTIWVGSSMVRASHRSSESCGFDPRMGLRNHFSDRTWRSFIYHLKRSPNSHNSNT